MSLSSTSSPENPRAPSDSLELWDWRRSVAELYAMVRATEPHSGWRKWCSERDRLFRDHSQSPVNPQARAEFAGLHYFPYDSSFRFLVDVGKPQSHATIAMEVGGDGRCTFIPSPEPTDLRLVLARSSPSTGSAGMAAECSCPSGTPRVAMKLLAAGVICWTRSRRGSRAGPGRTAHPRLQLRVQSILCLCGPMDLPTGAGREPASQPHPRR